MADQFVIREATEADAVAASAVINTATQEGDSWYKTPTSRTRVDAAGEQVAALCRADHAGAVFVAERPATRELLGVVHCDWRSGATGDIPGFPQSTRVYSFGMLSVPARNGSRGIGRALVQAAEGRLGEAARAAEPPSTAPAIEIDVVASVGPRRGNLLGWYGSQGYECVADATPVWWHIYGVVAEAYMRDGLPTVFAQRMRKPLC